MLKSGKYLAEHNNSIFDQYRIVMSVRETEKSYIYEMKFSPFLSSRRLP